MEGEEGRQVRHEGGEGSRAVCLECASIHQDDVDGKDVPALDNQEVANYKVKDADCSLQTVPDDPHLCGEGDRWTQGERATRNQHEKRPGKVAGGESGTSRGREARGPRLHVLLDGVELLELGLLLVVVDRSYQGNDNDRAEDCEALKSPRAGALAPHQLPRDDGEEARSHESIERHVLHGREERAVCRVSAEEQEGIQWRATKRQVDGKARKRRGEKQKNRNASLQMHEGGKGDRGKGGRWTRSGKGQGE